MNRAKINWFWSTLFGTLEFVWRTLRKDLMSFALPGPTKQKNLFEQFKYVSGIFGAGEKSTGNQEDTAQERKSSKISHPKEQQQRFVEYFLHKEINADP